MFYIEDHKLFTDKRYEYILLHCFLIDERMFYLRAEHKRYKL